MTRRAFLFFSIALCLALAPLARAQAKRATVSATLNATALQPGKDAVVAVVFDIKRGFHAQSHKPKDPDLIPLVVSLDADPMFKAGEVVYPPGLEENYPALGVLNIYSGKVVFYVPLHVQPDAKPGPLTIKGTVDYQICDDKSCFPPDKTPWSVETKVVAAGEAVSPNEPDLFKDYKPAAAAPTTRRTTTAPATQAAPARSAGPPPVAVGQGTQNMGVFYALGLAFLAGILFNIVPCVLPMLPIKVLGFAEISGHDRGKTVALASVFGLGIVSVFAVLAVLILALKTLTWGSQFSNPYFAWGMVVLLLVMSLWLFGFFTFNLPAGAYAFAPRHDTFFGNYLWGMLTAIFSTPCTGPLFPPILLWAQGQPTYVGVPAMMMVGVGMAFPYVLLSAFPQAARGFPRVGPWSELFKQMLGFMLLGFTVFFAAGRLTSSDALWWSVVPVAVLAGVYLMARTVQLSKEARAVGISSVIAVAMVTVTVLVACRFSGVFDPQPAAGATGSASAAVEWIPYTDATLAAARQQGKIVLVKFTANWCFNCKLIEGNVYHDADALQALRKHDVVTLKADLTKPDAPGSKRLLELEPTGGIPLTAIYAPGYDQPILISSVYTTSTLVKTLDQLANVKTASAQ
jgi:thiol:disulfide interchange protein DsbD